jgi:hypothetical protein
VKILTTREEKKTAEMMMKMTQAIHSRNFQVHDARGKSLRFCPSGINENTDIQWKTRINIDITKRFLMT